MIAARSGRRTAALIALTPVAVMLGCLPTLTTRFAAFKMALMAVLVFVGVLILRRCSLGWREGLPWLLLLGWTALSLCWTPARNAALDQVALWIGGGLWFVTVKQWRIEHRRDRDVVPLVGAWVGAAVVCSLIVLVQRAGALKWGLHDVTGTVGNPNRVAAVLVLCLPGAHLLLRGSRWWKLLGQAGLVVLPAGVIATRCQGAIVALLVLAIYWLFRCTPKWRPHRRRAAILSALLLGTIGFNQRVREAAATSYHGRLAIAHVSADIVSKHPIRGGGAGSYRYWAPEAQARQWSAMDGRWSNLHDAHNQVLSVWAEVGLPGLILLLLIFGVPLVRCFRTRDTVAVHVGAVGIGLVMLSVTETVLVEPTALLVALGWIALVPASQPPEFVGRPMIRGVMLMLATAALLGALSHLMADLHLARGQIDRGLWWRSEHPELVFNAALVRRYQAPEAAYRAARRAYDLQPAADRALLVGDAAAISQGPLVAERWYRRAVRLHPRWSRAYNNLGVILMRQGRFREAQRFLRRALSLRPGDKAIQANHKLAASRLPNSA